MSSSDLKPRGSRPSLVFLAVLFLGVVGVIAYRMAAPPAHAPVVSNPPAAASNFNSSNIAGLTASSNTIPLGTPISAALVLGDIDKWMAQHPDYHAAVETTLPSGTLMGKMDVYTYADAAQGQVLRLNAEMFVPQDIRYQAEKQSNMLEVYFPGTDHLIETDTSKLLLTMPALAAHQNSMTSLLKLARSSFAEASADLRVATLVLDSAALNLPETTGDIYLSLRTNEKGELLGVDEKAQGQRVITTIKYLSFDRSTVMRNAPVIPAGKVPMTNETMQAAMKAEILRSINKPLGRKI
jgi:hypothetical protein